MSRNPIVVKIRRIKNGEIGYCDMCGELKGSRLFIISFNHNRVYLCEKHFYLLKKRLERVI